MKLRTVLLTLGLTAVVALVVVLATSRSHGYEVRANLADADGLLTGSRVEVGGIGIGVVTSLKITTQDHALVTLSIDKPDAPVGTDASVVIRPADLLGEKYVDLSVGNRAKPASSGFTIATNHTQEATDFDQVIDVLAPTERDRLAVLIHETGVALFGRGADVSKLLDALPPSLSDAKALINQVTASNTQLEGLITHASGVVSTLAANQAALSHFVATGTGALSATAAHTADLAQSVAEAPALLTQLSTTLKGLDVAGATLRPAAAGLEKTAPALTDTLTELPGFTTAALPTLAEVRSISPQLVSLGRRAAPVIAKLRPTVEQLQTVATDSQPVTAGLDASIDNLLGTLQNWARAIQTADGASHEFRVSLVVSRSLIDELKPLILGTSSTKSSATPKHSGSSSTPRSGVSTTTSSLGQNLASSTQSVGAGVSSTVNKVLSGVGGAVSGVTSKLGLTQTTTSAQPTSTSGTSSLQNLLGYLMGGSK